jgi:serine/threonine-protein kinase
LNYPEPAQPVSGVRVGEVLAGKYRVDRVLGEGGMGVVVAAHHLQLDTRVAIKFLLPHMLTMPEAVARFTREARAASKITSEHVARVRDVGTLETGAPYMVMEFLDGGDLAGWIAQRGRLDIGQAVEFLLQASEAIAEAHHLGIVHRDLKPANLFCIQKADGLLAIKVLDFGISKVNDASSMSVTKTTAVMGSPLYMSPEQMTSSRDVDHRTDIWSLGVILFELLTGTVPFSGEMFSEICVKIATQAPPPLRAIRPDAPEGLEAIIHRCLEKDRNRRFASVGELAMALAPYGPPQAQASALRIARVAAGGDPRISNAELAIPGPGMSVSNPGLGRTTNGERAKGNRSVIFALAGVGATVLVAGGVWAAVHASAGKPTSETAAAQPSAAASSAAPTSQQTVAAAVTLAPPPASVPAAAPSPSTPPPPETQVASNGGGSPPATGGHAAGVGKPHGVAMPAATPANPLPAANPPPAAPPPAAKPAVKPGCDPNYYFDESGQKHWKKECF